MHPGDVEEAAVAFGSGGSLGLAHTDLRYPG
jgi:hypothetical protein